MNAKIIEGLKSIDEGIRLILSECTESESPKASNKSVEVEQTPDEKAIVELTREQLEGMTYNNIKKLAKERGVSAVGNRDEITARLLGETVSKSDDEVNEAPEEVPVDESDNDPVYAKVVESVADMSNEEIADILVDIGMSAKGKRESLIDKLVQAVRDGALEFDDDDDDTSASGEKEEVADKDTTAKTAETPEPDEDEEDDDTNDIDNPKMTKARKKAILAQDKEIREMYKNGEVSREELVEFLQEFYDTDDDMSDMSDGDILDTYIDAVCRLVDDDGEINEEGAYELNGEPACCGRFLKYSDDTKMFVCEHCGAEYEAE